MQTNIVPAVSVVMAVYNGGDYLAESIESILNQNWKDFEFIIINDGSTDQTASVIEYYSNIDSRIKIISRENRGLVASLNEGVAAAKAKLIARMDADDISLPTRLTEQVEFLNKNLNVVCVGTDPIIIDEDGDELIHLKIPATDLIIQQQLLLGHCPIEHPSVMFRKEVAIKVGGYRKEFEAAEDYDLWLRMGELGKLANINKPLIKYRFLNSSISAKNQTKQNEATRKAQAEALQRRNIFSEFSATNQWRQSEDNNSKYQFAIKFGWWAFSYKNRKAAIKYAKKAIKLMPWRSEGWRLLLSSLLKLKASI